jgi:hypothetical protein
MLALLQGSIFWAYLRALTKFHNICGLAYQGKKDIVFIFIIEYSSLMDFGP